MNWCQTIHATVKGRRRWDIIPAVSHLHGISMYEMQVVMWLQFKMRLRLSHIHKISISMLLDYFTPLGARVWLTHAKSSSPWWWAPRASCKTGKGLHERHQTTPDWNSATRSSHTHLWVPPQPYPILHHHLRAQMPAKSESSCFPLLLLLRVKHTPTQFQPLLNWT